MYIGRGMSIALAVAAIMIVSIGLAYSMWSQTLKVNGVANTGEVDFAIQNGSLILLDACGLQPGYGQSGGYDWNASYYPDPGAEQLSPPEGKDVGCTNVTLVDTDGDGDYDALNVTLVNAYPWYYTHIAFKVCNDGTIPVKIWRVQVDDKYYYELNEQELNQGVEVDLNNDTSPDLTIWWGDNFGKQLHPGQCADISLDLTVLQPAPQGATLNFLVLLQAVQWNEYSTPTPR